MLQSQPALANPSQPRGLAQSQEATPVRNTLDAQQPPLDDREFLSRSSFLSKVSAGCHGHGTGHAAICLYLGFQCRRHPPDGLQREPYSRDTRAPNCDATTCVRSLVSQDPARHRAGSGTRAGQGLLAERSSTRTTIQHSPPPGCLNLLLKGHACAVPPRVAQTLVSCYKVWPTPRSKQQPPPKKSALMSCGRSLLLHSVPAAHLSSSLAKFPEMLDSAVVHEIGWLCLLNPETVPRKCMEDVEPRTQDADR